MSDVTRILSAIERGDPLRIPGKSEESLDWFGKAIALLGPLVQREPRLATERLFLRNAHWGRAAALCRLKRDAESLKDWDRVLELNAAPAYEPLFRRNRALSLAHAGVHAKAVAEANALAEATGVAGNTLYDMACVCALSAGAVKEQAKLQERYGARAVDLLRQAIAKGFRNVQQINKDSDLDAVRRREDFKQLIAELTKTPN
jgi:eukaryotic-like serine/threonine-protein kinase